MNPSDPRHPWSRLVDAARRAPDRRDAGAPYGFSTRVAALAFAADRRAGSLFERFAWRAVGVAGLLALASVAVNYPALARTPAVPAPVADELVLPVDDAIAAVLDFGN